VTYPVRVRVKILQYRTEEDLGILKFEVPLCRENGMDISDCGSMMQLFLPGAVSSKG
jgi:hypothetical protein